MQLLHVHVYLREWTETSIAYSTSLGNSLMVKIQTAFMSPFSISLISSCCCSSDHPLSRPLVSQYLSHLKLFRLFPLFDIRHLCVMLIVLHLNIIHHQGMDMNAMEADPNAPMQTLKAKQAQEKKDRKVKPTRGGGGGFGAR